MSGEGLYSIREQVSFRPTPEMLKKIDEIRKTKTGEGLEVMLSRAEVITGLVKIGLEEVEKGKTLQVVGESQG